MKENCALVVAEKKLAVRTVTAPIAPLPTTAVMRVRLSTRNDCAGTPPNNTPVTVLKFAPVMMTVVPCVPERGDTEAIVTVGGGGIMGVPMTKVLKPENGLLIIKLDCRESAPMLVYMPVRVGDFATRAFEGIDGEVRFKRTRVERTSPEIRRTSQNVFVSRLPMLVLSDLPPVAPVKASTRNVGALPPMLVLRKSMGKLCPFFPTGKRNDELFAENVISNGPSIYESPKAFRN